MKANKAFMMSFMVILTTSVSAHHGTETYGLSIGGSNNRIQYMKKGSFQFSTLYLHNSFKALSEIALYDLRSVSAYSLNIGYGISDRVSIFGILPYTCIQVRKDHKNLPQSENLKSISDFTLGTIISLYSNEIIGVSFIGGIECPNGNFVSNDSNIAFQSNTSSGSYDPLMGAYVQYKISNTSPLQLQATTLFSTQNSEEYQMGALNNVNLYYNKRFEKNCEEKEETCTSELCNCANLLSKFTLSIGLNYLSNSKHRQAGSVILNTGRNSLESSLGLTYTIGTKFSIPLFINLPILQNVKGAQNFLSHTINTGVIYHLQTKKKSSTHSHDGLGSHTH